MALQTPYVDASTKISPLTQRGSLAIKLATGLTIEPGRASFEITNFRSMSNPPPVTFLEFKPKSLYHSEVRGLSPPYLRTLNRKSSRYDIIRRVKAKDHILYHPMMFYQPFAGDYSELIDVIMAELTKFDAKENESFSSSFVKFNINHDLSTIKTVLQSVSQKHFGEVEKLIKERMTREKLTWADVGRIEEELKSSNNNNNDNNENNNENNESWLGGDAKWWTEGFYKMPLHVASKNGHSGIVEALLDHDKTIGGLGLNGCGPTPIQLALEGGHEDMVDVLLPHEKDIDIETPPSPKTSNSKRSSLLNVLTGMAWRDTSLIIAFRVVPPYHPKLDSHTYVSDEILKGQRVEYTVKVIDHDCKHPKKLVGREELERGYILRAMELGVE
ncbi:hypothetical protein TL16_g11145 [Triparma laevis f. inornata]|uniref:Uncharacterized protein n=1 Tax=Triparma laevis f. inornata TaxID=1714386 RepID=A0A9W7ER11_9STRA|nr:hypothetical protein TL16_g11145 [Triparma laevis f. inornata]